MHYDLLIYKHGTETKPDDGAYYERHHVVPKSLGGSNEPSNLVYMTGKAHFVAHHLLFKIHGVGPMASAFWAMCTMDKTRSRLLKASDRKKSPETRAKMSASHLLRFKLLKESNNG